MTVDPAAKPAQGVESSPTERHRVNFFMPKTPCARANMKMIIAMVLVWAVGVFGFQIALMILNKKVPEPTLAQFESAWPAVAEDPGADPAMKQEFARAVLMVLGKNIAVSDDDKMVLNDALSWTVYDQLSPTEHIAVNGHVAALAKLSSDTAETAPEPGVIASHQSEIRTLAAAALGLKDEGFDSLMADLLPYSLMEADKIQFSNATRQSLPEIMRKYLIHNRNVLTDTKFFGFPFHYWYTAQFLLIMFVALCGVYAIITDRLHRRYGLVEE